MSNQQNFPQYFPKPSSSGNNMQYGGGGGNGNNMGSGYYNQGSRGDKGRNMQAMSNIGPSGNPPYMNEAIPPKFLAEMNNMGGKKGGNQEGGGGYGNYNNGIDILIIRWKEKLRRTE